MQTLYYSPGQQVTIVIEGLDTNSVLTDGYSAPVISNIYFPNLTLASGYPATATRVQTGIYEYKFTLPTGAAAVGTYIVVVTYFAPTTNAQSTRLYQIIVTAPGGNYTVTPG